MQEAKMSSIIAYIALTFSIIIFTKLLFFTSKSKLIKNLPPSPPSRPFIGHLHLLKKPLHHALAALAARHGPILFLQFGSRPVLVVSSASLAKECFTKNDLAFANRVHFPSAKIFSYNYKSLSSANFDQHWRNMRQIASDEVLSSNRVAASSGIRSGEVRALVKNLFREASTGGEFTKVDLKDRIFEFSLKNIMKMITRERKNGREDLKEFHRHLEELFSVLAASNIGDFLPLLRWVDFQGVKKKVLRLHSYMSNFMGQLIQDSKDESKNNKQTENTMIDVMLELQKKDPESYSDPAIKSLISGMLVAGTGTSYHSVEWAMSLLLNNPDKLKKAQDEIDSTIGHDRIIQESDLPNLPYLHCIINETLRLFPPGALLLPHESREECVVGGYDIPRGTMLLVNAYVIHRDPTTWEEPEKFLPERFENRSKVEPHKFLPFGMGRRKCPGELLAMRMMGMELGALIQCFQWQRTGEKEVDMTEGSGIALSRYHPLQAMYKPRESLIRVLDEL